MKKNEYIRPEVSVCRMETTQMMANSPLGRYDSPADAELDVLVNENAFTDIWGN